MSEKYKDYDWLREQYEGGLTSKQIAEICNVSSDNITRRLRKIGIRQKGLARIVGDSKKCDQCCELLPLCNFKKCGGKHSFDGYLHICKRCYNKRHAVTISAYNSRDYVVAKTRLAGIVYCKNNREKLNKRRRDWWSKNKHRLDLRINGTMSARVNRVLNGKKCGFHWEDIVGYTVYDLKIHIESLFEEWMSWDNWGKYDAGNDTWHIDHIRPIASFNITSIDCEDFKECWNLKNLRPLLALDNFSKGSKYTGEL